MMYDKFTENAKKAINVAREVAYRLSHNYIGTEHLLIGLVEVNGVASRVKRKWCDRGKGLRASKSIDRTKQWIRNYGCWKFHSKIKQILEQSYKELLNSKPSWYRTYPIALIKETNCITSSAFEYAGW